MRVALISPYSYTYPGGVGRHVEALAEQLLEAGHEVRLLAPYDPDDRLARVMHRGARPQPRPLSRPPDHGRPDHRAAHERRGFEPGGLPRDGRRRRPRASQRRLRRGARARAECAVCLAGTPRRRPGCRPSPPSTPTRPARWSSRFTANIAGARRLYSKLTRRIAVSEAARWTAQRFYGGRYRIMPNGVDLSAARPGSQHDATTSCASCSSAAPRTARACRCCCAPSRRCAAPACGPA